MPGHARGRGFPGESQPPFSLLSQGCQRLCSSSQLDPPNEAALLSTDIVVRPAFSATWPFAVARSLQVKAGLRTPDEFSESGAEEDAAVDAAGSDQDGVTGETSALSKTQLKRAARQEKMEKAAQAGAARRR